MQDTQIRSSLQRGEYSSAWQEFMNAVQLLLDDPDQSARLRQLWIDYVAGRYLDDVRGASNSAFLIWDYARELVRSEVEVTTDEKANLDEAERTLIKVVSRLWPRGQRSSQKNQALSLLCGHFALVRFAIGFKNYPRSRQRTPLKETFCRLCDAAAYFATSLHPENAPASVLEQVVKSSESIGLMAGSQNEYPDFALGADWREALAQVRKHIIQTSRHSAEAVFMAASGLEHIFGEAVSRKTVGTQILLIGQHESGPVLTTARVTLTRVNGPKRPFVAPDPVKTGVMVNDPRWRASNAAVAGFAEKHSAKIPARGYLWGIEFPGEKEAFDMAGRFPNRQPQGPEVRLFQRSLALTGNSAGAAQAALVLRAAGNEFDSESVAFSAMVDVQGRLQHVDVSQKILNDQWETSTLQKIEHLIVTQGQSTWNTVLLSKNGYVTSYQATTIFEGIEYLRGIKSAETTGTTSGAEKKPSAERASQTRAASQSTRRTSAKEKRATKASDKPSPSGSEDWADFNDPESYHQLPPRRKSSKKKRRSKKSNSNKAIVYTGLAVLALAVCAVAASFWNADSGSVAASKPEKEEAVASPEQPDKPANPDAELDGSPEEAIAKLMLEAQKQTHEEIRKNNASLAEILFEFGLRKSNEVQQEQQTPGSPADKITLDDQDAVYSAKPSEKEKAAGRPLNVSVRGDTHGSHFFWCLTTKDGNSEVVHGAYGKRNITIENIADVSDIVLVVLDPPETNDSLNLVLREAPILLVPTYFYPDSSEELSTHWQDFRELVVAVRGHAQVYAILNPESGSVRRAAVTKIPTTDPSEDYVRHIKELNRWQIPWFAYITYKRGGTRTLIDAQGGIHPISRDKDLECWVNSYPGMCGVFLDEVPTDASHKANLQQFCSKVRTNLGAIGISNPIIVGNPGTTCPAEFASGNLFDWLCIDARSARLSDFVPPSDVPVSARFGSLLHSVSAEDDVPATLKTLADRGADFFFLTDQVETQDSKAWTRMPKKFVSDAIVTFVKEH